jgi:flavin-dependent dehydrogenase
LAYYSRKTPLSGDGFILAGDAAHLIDPAWGHGIDKAMISGRYAAETAINAIQSNNFDVESLKIYDRIIYRRLGKMLQFQYLMVKLFGKHSWLLRLIAPVLKVLDKRIS